MIREYERFLTAVFNCFCQPAAARLLDTVGARLHDDGFRGRLSFFSGAGGAISADLARQFPGAVVGVGSRRRGDGLGRSGQANGSRRADRRHGRHQLRCIARTGRAPADLAAVQAGRARDRDQPRRRGLDRRGRRLDCLDRRARGSPGRAPQRRVHAGPGVLRTRRTEPTVTDAAAVLGSSIPTTTWAAILPRPRRASRRHRTRLAAPFGWSPSRPVRPCASWSRPTWPTPCAESASNEATTRAEFLFFAFGGTLPMFVTRICEQLGMAKAVVPRNSSVLLRLRRADCRLHPPLLANRRVGSPLPRDVPAPSTTGAARCSTLHARKPRPTASTLPTARSNGRQIFGSRVRSSRWRCRCPTRRSARTTRTTRRGVPRVYERQYGKGAAWADSAVHLLNLNATCSAPRPRPALRACGTAMRPPWPLRRVHDRSRSDGGDAIDVPVYVEDDLDPAVPLSARPSSTCMTRRLSSATAGRPLSATASGTSC